jgi:hypothetical protein
MRATLFNKGCWYNLFQEKIGIGSTYHELKGYKLSKKNCDELFAIPDVESLAEEVFPIDHTTKQINLKKGFIAGFNQATELNKEKMFTIEDMRECWETAQQSKELQRLIVATNHFKYSQYQFDSYINDLPPLDEIEVEIEMEDYGYCEGCTKSGMWHCAHADTCGQNVTLKRPKLDENGCLILKKI